MAADQKTGSIPAPTANVNQSSLVDQQPRSRSSLVPPSTERSGEMPTHRSGDVSTHRSGDISALSSLGSIRTRTKESEPVVFCSSDMQVDNSGVTTVTCSKTFYRRIAFESKEMLRGTRVADVLKRFGHILTDCQGSASTFDLSAPVGQIDVFLSHNWSTARWEKFLALALYFNSGKAFAAMCVFSVLTVPFTVQGILPVVSVGLPGLQNDAVFLSFQDSLSYSEAAWVGMSATLVGLPALLLTLVLGHEIGASRSGCSGPVIFLDKTCIHQTDPELKQKGIESLAAFLAHSKTMLIVYSSNYLRKLWTVYELATMLLLHPGRKIVVMPTFLPKFFLGGLLLYTVFLMLEGMTRLQSLSGSMSGNLVLALTSLLIVGMCVTGLCVHMAWERQRAEIKDVIKSFSIRNAKCSAEADRATVQRSIVTFIRELQLVTELEGEDEEAFHDRALNAFDALVRREVPPALKASFGRQGVPYQYTLLVGASHALRFVDLLPWYIHNRAFVTLVVTGVTYCTVWLGIIPLWLAVVSRIAAGSARTVNVRPAWKRRLVIFAQFVVTMAVSVIDWYALTVLSLRVRHGDIAALVFFIILVSLNGYFVLVAYRPMPPAKVDRACLHDVLTGIPSPRTLDADSGSPRGASELLYAASPAPGALEAANVWTHAECLAEAPEQASSADVVSAGTDSSEGDEHEYLEI